MENQEKCVELKNSTRAEMPGARNIGPADPNERIEVTVILRRASAPSAFPSTDRLGATPPSNRVHLSREAFAAQHGASEDDIAKIRAFATRYGLEVVSERPDRRSVFLAGTAQALSKAFGVQLNRYQSEKTTYRGPVSYTHLYDHAQLPRCTGQLGWPTALPLFISDDISGCAAPLSLSLIHI